MKNYPKDWYKYLKKGDIVECISMIGDNDKHRPIGSHLKIHEDFRKQICYESKENSTECNSSAFGDFIPIQMQAFPQLNEINYEIY